MPHTASTAQVPQAYASAHARDIVRAGVEDLASVGAVWAALHAVERAALPLAPQELAYVAACNSSAADPTGDDSSDDASGLSPFLSSAVPAIKFPRYALHVAEATGYGHTGLAVGLALMGRYAAVSGRGVTPLSMHRLFATCMQLGMKTASDIFVKNVYVAPLVGMTLVELNVLECVLATALDFRTMVTPAELTSLPRALADLEPATTSMADVQAVFANVCSVAPPPPPPPLPPPPVPAAAPEADHPGWTPANGLVELYAPGDSKGPRRQDSGGSSVNALPSSTETSARGGAPERCGASERGGGVSGFGSMVRGPMSFSVLPGAPAATAPGDVASAAPPAAAGAAAP